MALHHRGWLLVCGLIWASSATFAQDTLNFPTLGAVHADHERFAEVIAPDARIEVIASGFDWTEGPVWMPDEEGGSLLFSDIPRNTIYRWVEGKGVSKFLQPSGYTGVEDYGAEPGSNGLIFDGDGRLVCCEHGDRRLSVLTPGGGKRTLIDNYHGKRLNSPNDAVLHSSGAIYFTDPPYGLPNHFEDSRRELDFCGVYRWSPDGALRLLTRDLTRPNGIGLSPDEKTLYVAQSDPAAPLLYALPVVADGATGDPRVLHDFSAALKKGWPGLPDGMAIDHQGWIFVTAPGGVWVLTPEGEALGRISTGENTSNCTFGGADGSVLYFTSDMYICRIQTRTRGLKSPTRHAQR